jgi:hypothetical protein
MEREGEGQRWAVTREDLHGLRTQLTVAMLAAGQLGRKCARTIETRRLLRYLSEALTRLRAQVDEIDEREIR